MDFAPGLHQLEAKGVPKIGAFAAPFWMGVLEEPARYRPRLTSGCAGGANGCSGQRLVTNNPAMATSTFFGARARIRGFTLIELMVTLAVAAVLAGLAAPSIKDFIVRSRMTNIGNEFTSAVLRARNEAINRNTCVTLCMSTTAGGAAPVCATSGDDWQVGWIAFLNPSCNSGAVSPSDSIDLFLTRTSVGDDFHLTAQSGAPRKMMFNPRGTPGLGAAAEYDLGYQSVGNSYTTRFGFNICLDALGRTRTIPTDKSCATY